MMSSNFVEFFLIFRQILCVFLFVLVVVPYEMPALTLQKLEKILDEKLRPISDLSEQLKQALESISSLNTVVTKTRNDLQ